MKTHLHAECRRWHAAKRIAGCASALALLGPVLALTGCAREEAKAAPPPAAVKSVDDRFAIRIGDRTVQLQLAVLQHELTQGLMFRQSMGADEGMLFVFSRPSPQSFWMRNCFIPLDIGFIDPTGELKEVAPMYPGNEHPVPSHSHNIQFCLEMNQGWFARLGVKSGDKLDLKAVSEAMRARGFKPEDFHLP
ncbi:MAG TPA: DUF192 domain-containing protein [Candidatus Didemnitutus sp.]|nr:DUF192 domain-containing protein [Candidatus Didemnitutus sp.]